MKKILLIGASGLIGKKLVSDLKNYSVEIFRGRDVLQTDIEKLADLFANYDVIINLSGKSVFTLWTKKARKEIYNSRILTTRKIVSAINLPEKNVLFINASAIGIYKDSVKSDETTMDYADNFLAHVVADWEKEAGLCKKPMSILRIGVVLSRKGGFFKQIRMLTRLNLGAYFGKGRQKLSFIHIDDLTRAVIFIIENKILGVVNLVSPLPSEFKTAVHCIKKATNAFIVWRIPVFIIKSFLGQTSALFLDSKEVYPGVLMRNNFTFEFANIEEAIKNLESN